MTEHHEKVKVLKQKLHGINKEASDIKTQLKKAKKDLFSQNFYNSKQNVASMLDIHISLRSIMVFLVVVGFLVGVVFFIKYLSGFSLVVTKEEGLDTLETIQESLTEAESLNENVKEEAASSKNNSAQNEEFKGETSADIESNTEDGVLDLGEIDTVNVTLGTNDDETEEDVNTDSDEISISEQKLITSYDKVTMGFTGKGFTSEQKTGFSKVLKLFYKVTNNANGKIQIDTLSYQYESDPKVVVSIDLDEGLIGSGKSKEFTLDASLVPKRTHLGTYSDSATKIKYSINIKDDSGSIMATASKEFTVN